MAALVLNPHKPLAVYDSGRGADAVAAAIIQQHPLWPLVVFKDSQAFPYGKKTPEELRQRVLYCLDHLQQQHPQLQAVIFACHTISNVVLPIMPPKKDLPCIGISQATAQWLGHNHWQSLLWLATSASIRSSYLPQLAKQQGFLGQLIPVACDDWVQAIEAQQISTQAIHQLIQQTLHHYIPHKSSKDSIQGILLGCTHFAHWKEAIQKASSPHLIIIDPQQWLAQTLKTHPHHQQA